MNAVNEQKIDSFVVKMPPDLLAELVEVARKQKCSIGSLVTDLLSRSVKELIKTGCE